MRATSNYDDLWNGSAYRVEVHLDAPLCTMSLRIYKVTTVGGWVQLLALTNQPFPSGALWRSFVRDDGPSPASPSPSGSSNGTVNDTSLTTGKPGVGHVLPGATQFAELPVSLGGIDRISPSAATSLSARPQCE